MDIFSQYPVLLVVIGIVLLIVEFAVLGFSTLFLVFIAFACFATALLQFIGIIPENLLWSTSSVAVFTILIGVLLWKPLRRLQNQQQSQDAQPNSFNGMQFRLPSELGPNTSSEYQYSGINWKVELDPAISDSLPQGTAVVVTQTSVGKMLVKPVSDS